MSEPKTHRARSGHTLTDEEIEALSTAVHTDRRNALTWVLVRTSPLQSMSGVFGTLRSSVLLRPSRLRPGRGRPSGRPLVVGRFHRPCIASMASRSTAVNSLIEDHRADIRASRSRTMPVRMRCSVRLRGVRQPSTATS